MFRNLTSLAFVALLASALASGQVAAVPSSDQNQFLTWADAQAQNFLAERAQAVAAIRTPAQARARQAEAREKLLKTIGGLVEYSGPLRAQTLGKLTAPTHTIEKVIFESLPGYWVTGNLYLPKSPGRHPAVLFSIGHWDEGKPAAQRMAANFAANGFVVLAYDPVGQGERLQGFDARIGHGHIRTGVAQHLQTGSQAILLGQAVTRYFIHDSRRAIDYLLSRPEVDPARLGATGCSGGGTQTAFLGAVEPRLQVVAPLCYINSFQTLYAGSVGDAEQSPPGFIAEGLDQSDLIALAAPRAYLIGNTELDFFTPKGARQAVEDAKGIYRALDAEHKITWVLGPGGHGVPLMMREAVYSWFARWLQDRSTPVKEQPLHLFYPHELEVLPQGQVAADRPSRDLTAILADQVPKQLPSAKLRTFVDGLVPMPPEVLPPMEEGNEYSWNGLLRRDVLVRSNGYDLRGALLRSAAGNSTAAQPLPKVLHLESGLQPSFRAQELARAGALVFSFAPRVYPTPSGLAEQGDWLASTRANFIGQPLAALRATDVLAALQAWQPQREPVLAVAEGTLALPLLLARAKQPRWFNRVWLDRAPSSLRSAFATSVHQRLYEMAVPGLLLHGDLLDVAQLAPTSKTNLLWLSPTDWNNNVHAPKHELHAARYFDERFERATAWLLDGKPLANEPPPLP